MGVSALPFYKGARYKDRENGQASEPVKGWMVKMNHLIKRAKGQFECSEGGVLSGVRRASRALSELGCGFLGL